MISQQLSLLAKGHAQRYLRIGQVGIEKESLRTDPQANIAQSDHPSELGATLTHPFITTDYSEALLEFVTPPLPDSGQALAFLDDIHRFVYPRIGQESLWPGSMPPRLAGEQSIRIAHYGSSNLGQMKEVYRRGLGYRYGKIMQVIAGIHVNLSIDEAFWPRWQALKNDSSALRDFVDQQYFIQIRNLQRIGWLIPYLFGASPVVDESFRHAGAGMLAEFDRHTRIVEDATSLRLGDIGYTNQRENEIGIKACYSSLPEYVRCLAGAISKPYRPYEEIGVCVDGAYRQLNANILQIENEYYSNVRPKQITRENEKPTHALLHRGVRYVEIRSLDLNPFSALGVEQEQLDFIELLFLYCLLADDRSIDRRQREEIDINAYEVSHHGRRPNLELRLDGESVPLTQWGESIFSEMRQLAELLDKPNYIAALDRYEPALRDPDETLSARILKEMRLKSSTYLELIHDYAKTYQAATQPLASEREKEFMRIATESLAKQKQIEAADSLPFADFLSEYFARQ